VRRLRIFGDFLRPVFSASRGLETERAILVLALHKFVTYLLTRQGSWYRKQRESAVG